MANEIYKKTKQKLGLSTLAALNTADIRVAIVSSAYVPDLTNDEFLSDLGANVLATAQQLTGVTLTDGVLDAADTPYPAMTAGSTAACVVGYIHTGVAGTSPLLFFANNVTGFPFNTTGAGATLRWDNGPHKILAL